jgi:hypothetical protein
MLQKYDRDYVHVLSATITYTIVGFVGDKTL